MRVVLVLGGLASAARGGMRAVAALIVLGGCAQLFGIENTTGSSSGSDGGPPPDMASLRFVRLSIGAKVVMTPQDVTGQTATYVIPDASAAGGLRRVSAMQTATDTWSAALPEATPPIAFTLPDNPMPIPRMLALPSRQVVGLYSRLEHPNPVPPPPGATVAVDVTTTAISATDLFRLYTVGSWSLHQIPTPAVGATAVVTTIAYEEPGTNLSDGFSKLTTDDVAIVYRLALNAAQTGYNMVGYYQAPAFDQTGSDAITGTMSVVKNDQRLALTLHPGQVARRYGGVRPAVASLQMTWALRAAPGYAYASNVGPLLASNGVQPTDSGAVGASYGNPFAALGWNTLLSWGTLETRSFTVMGLPVTLYAGMSQLAQPSPGLDLTLPAPLPTSISVAQTPLLSDGVAIAIDPSKAVELSFVPEQPNATLFEMHLYELVPDATGMSVQYQLRMQVTGAAPEFTVPPSAFVSGHTYTVRAMTYVGGYGAVASGDLTNRTMPFAQAYADSGVFTVM